jgi:hypothetical protein
MKKLTVLLMICSLFVITTMVFADTSNDGINWTNGTGEKYVNDSSVNRTGYTVDGNDIAGQETSVKIDLFAYIPCYLKLDLTGNQGNTVAESFGPDAKAEGSVNGYQMVFDNELGGFVDSDWKVKATGKNAEVAPDSGYNIAACDTFKVVVYSNDNFKYDVISAPLTSTKTGSDAKLNLIMGTSDSLAGVYTNDLFNEEKTINIGGEQAACSTLTKYHKFAVPYATSTAQGEYSGDVTFKAYTI